MNPEEIAMISASVNLLLGFSTVYLAKHVKLFRKLRDLNISIIEKFDDHKLDDEETKELMDEISDIIY